MDKVTVDQCKTAVAEKGFKRVDHHSCGGCGYMTGYVFERADVVYRDPSLEGLQSSDTVVGFDPGCDCSSFGRARFNMSSWDSFAENFNMQTPEVRAIMWAAFLDGKPTHE